MKKLCWEDYLFIIILTSYVVAIVSLIIQLKQLPSPLFGGDFYYQLGNVNHIQYGGGLFTGSNILGSLPGYLPLYSMIVGAIAALLNLGGITAMFVMSVIFGIVAFTTIYFVSKTIFRNKLLALLTTILVLSIRSAFILKYTPFTFTIVTPLLFILLYKTITKKNYKYAILTGLMYGATGISHGVAFIAASILLGITFLYFGIIKNLKNKEGLIRFVKLGLVILIIGILIALLYWYNPIFTFNGQTSENYLDWNNRNFEDFDVQTGFLFGTLRSLFFNFDSIIPAILTVLSIIGIIAIFLLKPNNTIRFIKVFLVTAAIGLFHFFLTRPLLGVEFYPARMADFFVPLIQILLVGLGFFFLSKKIKIIRKKKVMTGIIIAIMIFNLIAFSAYSKDNRWVQNGRTSLSDDWKEAEEYIKESSEINDVFLTTNELGFALNALTGRKLLTSRRAQNDPFLDMDERIRASAAILYGNDNDLRKELIEEYNLDYLFWHVSWITTDFRLNQEGQITDKFDPLLLFDTPQNREYLDALKINYLEQNTWVDPALQGEDFKTFDLLIILPNRIDFYTPWHPNLDAFLEEEWTYEKDNENIVKIYKIKERVS